jgi:ammonium transporter Rh
MWFGKLDMEVVLNATLAGGVSVGSSSDLVVTGAIAMAIGTLAGIVSAVGFLWLGGKL